MEEFSIENGILIKYNGNASRVIIPDGVEELASRAFSNNSSLTEVIFPESVKQIGGRAFWKCVSLRSISLPEGLFRLGAGGFGECSSLIHIDIPKSLTGFSPYVFSGCSSLTEYNVPEHVTSLQEGAFARCGALKSVTIHGAVDYIDADVFDGCDRLVTLNIPLNNLHLMEKAGKEAYKAAVCGWLYRYASGVLPLKEKRELMLYIGLEFDRLTEILFDDPIFIRYVTEKKLINPKKANKLLFKCQNTECRVILLNYVDANGGEKPDINERFKL